MGNIELIPTKLKVVCDKNLSRRHEEVPGQQSSQTEHEDDDGYGLAAVEAKHHQSEPGPRTFTRT